MGSHSILEAEHDSPIASQARYTHPPVWLHAGHTIFKQSGLATWIVVPGCNLLLIKCHQTSVCRSELLYTPVATEFQGRTNPCLQSALRVWASECKRLELPQEGSRQGATLEKAAKCYQKDPKRASV